MDWPKARSHVVSHAGIHSIADCPLHAPYTGRPFRPGTAGVLRPDGCPVAGAVLSPEEALISGA